VGRGGVCKDGGGGGVGRGLNEEMSCHGVPRYVISGGVLVLVCKDGRELTTNPNGQQ